MVKTIVLSAFLVVALGSLSEVKAEQRSDVHCLAETIFREARGTNVEEKILVGNVVLNRMKSGKFPETACGVLNQKGQFPWINKFSMKERQKTINREKIEYDESFVLAVYLLQGKIDDASNGALFFHSRKGGKRKWTNGLLLVQKTKYHYYYKQ